MYKREGLSGEGEQLITPTFNGIPVRHSKILTMLLLSFSEGKQILFFFFSFLQRPCFLASQSLPLLLLISFLRRAAPN